MDPVTLILAILVAFFVGRYVFSGKLNKLERLGILHPKPWPIVGCMAPVLLRRSHFTETFTKIYKQSEEANYVGYYEFSEPVIMIRTPELVKSIAVKNFDHFVDHRGFVADQDGDDLFAKNLVGLRGEKWKEVRNLLSPAFTSSKMKAMFKLMSACGKNFVDNLADSPLIKSNVLDTKDAFTRYTNDVIATCGFGISVDSVKNPNNEFFLLGKAATNFDGFRGMKFFIIRNYPKISRFFNMKFIAPEIETFFENLVRETIETRDREGITRPDMIQLMMESRGKKSADHSDQGLSIRDMTAQAFIFFLGGFDTVATLMCFLAHEVSINSEVQAKLRDEVDEVLRVTNGELTYEAINGMQYLDAVVNETLRLWPVGAFLDRICVRTFELPAAFPDHKPIVIEPGQCINLPAFTIHRDPKYYPNPEVFDPERFMGSRKNEIDPYAYFPFGLGPRMCIANRFALLETKVLMFHLLEKFSLKPTEKMELPLKLDKSNVTLKPEGGFWLKIESRKN